MPLSPSTSTRPPTPLPSHGPTSTSSYTPLHPYHEPQPPLPFPPYILHTPTRIVSPTTLPFPSLPPSPLPTPSLPSPLPSQVHPTTPLLRTMQPYTDSAPLPQIPHFPQPRSSPTPTHPAPPAPRPNSSHHPNPDRSPPSSSLSAFTPPCPSQTVFRHVCSAARLPFTGTHEARRHALLPFPTRRFTERLAAGRLLQKLVVILRKDSDLRHDHASLRVADVE